jgi:multidrug resistance efflux pump
MKRARAKKILLGFAFSLISLSGHAQTTVSAPAQARTNVLSLGAARTGVVQSILVSNGAHVDRGQLIAQLDCRPLQKEIEFRAASLAAADAALERVRNGPRPEEIAIAEAGVGVGKARAEEALAALERADALKAGVTITEAQVLAVQRDSRIADALLMDAHKKLALLRAGSRSEDIAEAKARRDAAAAYLEEGGADLDQCSVHAPAAGTIQIVATIGQLVSIYAPTPIALLTPDADAR